MFIISTPVQTLILNKAIRRVILENLNNRVISDKLIHDVVDYNFTSEDIVYGIFFISVSYSHILYYFDMNSSVRKLKSIELYNMASKYTQFFMIILFILFINNVEEAS
jgi:hypothetical protein